MEPLEKLAVHDNMIGVNVRSAKALAPTGLFTSTHFLTQITKFFCKQVLKINNNERSQLENNKIQIMKPYLKEWESAWHREHFYKVTLCRMRIGHTWHIQLNFCGGDPPICNHCGEAQTVLHIVFNCPHYQSHRNSCFPIFIQECVAMHPALFPDGEALVPVTQVLNFLNDISLLHLL